MAEDVQRHSVHTLVFRSLKRTHDLFLLDQKSLPEQDPQSLKLKMGVKAGDQYGLVRHLVSKQPNDPSQRVPGPGQAADAGGADGTSKDVALYNPHSRDNPAAGGHPALTNPSQQKALLPLTIQQKQASQAMPKPQWHPPWKLMRVISGHIGWVRCLAVEPGNQWFASGSNDRIIKIWDLATGTLKLSLTGHVSAVRGLAVSSRQPYLFSCGEDKQVKCWDLEYNKVIRHYHGHLSACYDLALHPTIDVLVTCGRDSVARVWDMRTKANIHTLSGHTSTVASVVCQANEPQVITGSHDNTVRLWDLAAGKCLSTLTNHKKSVRSVVLHPKLYMFASASPDSIKQWKCPDGKFIQTMSGHNAIINCLAANEENVLVSGGDNGTMHFWDWRTGYNFQRLQAPVQPGSMDSEAGIFTAAFDQSGSRLITGDADKTIKIFKEDETATEETHPINWKPDIIKRRRY
ncbi:unnamed protein product [Cyprideis torosa]|uniref:Pleiotropic regulator 1 n=1 Tax=Cyprideis torosa TaxID=163714 RepID=A0A7R8WCL0_9CRUS|nr:unnamed protein product [Cyprideis torosa]CAG0892163.1 unnamed protein product [Cyprideis torosa]